MTTELTGGTCHLLNSPICHSCAGFICHSLARKIRYLRHAQVKKLACDYTAGKGQRWGSFQASALSGGCELNPSGEHCPQSSATERSPKWCKLSEDLSSKLLFPYTSKLLWYVPVIQLLERQRGSWGAELQDW